MKHTILTLWTESAKHVDGYGSYKCSECGERHASDETETLCSVKDLLSKRREKEEEEGDNS